MTFLVPSSFWVNQLPERSTVIGSTMTTEKHYLHISKSSGPFESLLQSGRIAGSTADHLFLILPGQWLLVSLTLSWCSHLHQPACNSASLYQLAIPAMVAALASTTTFLPGPKY